MTTRIILILIPLLLTACGVKQTINSNYFSGIYSNSDDFGFYEIKFVNDSLLRMTQTFHCVNLPDSLRSRGITVLYKAEEPQVLKSKKNIKRLNTNNLTYIRVHMVNLSHADIKYPFVEDSEDCSLFNEINRFDRKIFDGRTIFSPFDKANIINFKTTFFDYIVNDHTISFALKVFEK